MAAAMSNAEYGVISAYRAGRPKESNDYSHNMLLGDLKAMGYNPIESIGEWNGIPEKSWFVPGIKPDILMNLGTKYRQEAVVYRAIGYEPRVVTMDWLQQLLGLLF